MIENQLSQIFKTEYSNLVAVLCHYYGVLDIQTAQDIVSDTFLKAMKSWSHKGIPENPKAWLRKVAVNQLKDQHRRSKTFRDKIQPHITESTDLETLTDITEEIISDSQLRLMFVVCNPDLTKKGQFCLALRLLCGFSIDEIAKALLSSKDSINKTLYRAKKSIKDRGTLNDELSPKDYQDRLDSVLRVIYLLYNEGYYSSVKEENIREDVCWEALRLALFLAHQEELERHSVYALVALMCFHTSRIQARSIGDNGDLLYDHQDKSKWNQELILKGEKYIKKAAKSKKVTKYHIEASIAYWHTTDHPDKWNQILYLYNRLLMIEYSTVIALNRTYALARARTSSEAITEALKFDLKNNHHYHCLLAELYRMDNKMELERKHLTVALELATKKSEIELIKRKLNQ